MLKAITSKQNFNSIYTNINTLKISHILIKKNKTSPCSPDKNIQIFAKKKIKHCVKNKPRIICLRRTTKINQTLNNMLFTSLIHKNLAKYSITPTQFNSNIITNIIFDENTHYVSKFKDFLYWDDDGEFLKAFFPKKKQKEKMERILFFYTHFYNMNEIYSKYLRIGDCTNVMLKYYKNKKKIVEKDKSADTENVTKNSNGNKLDNSQKIKENIFSKQHTKLLSISMTLSKIANPLEEIGNNKALMTTRDSSKGFLSRNTKGTFEENNGPLEFASGELTIKSIINNMNQDKKKIKPKIVINNNNLNRLKTLMIQTKFGPPQKNKNKNLNINLPTMQKYPQKVSNSNNNNCRIPKLNTANYTINSQTKIKLFSNIVNPNQKNKILQIKTACLTERTYSNPKSSHNTCSNAKKSKGIIISIPKSKTFKSSQPSFEKTKKQRAKIKKSVRTNNLKLNLIAMKKLVIK